MIGNILFALAVASLITIGILRAPIVWLIVPFLIAGTGVVIDVTAVVKRTRNYNKKHRQY